MAAAKARLEKERVMFKAARIETRKQLAMLASGCNSWMFSEGADLSGSAEEFFARLSD
jgi:hypothetical protein